MLLVVMLYISAICCILLSGNVVAVEISDQQQLHKRSLLEGPLQFLTNILPHVKSADKPLEFLSQEHIDNSKNLVVKSTKPIENTETTTSNAKQETVQFLDIQRDKSKAPSSTTNKGHEIHFKTDTVENKKPVSKPKHKPKTKKDEYINIHDPIEFINPHPVISPRNGTDISEIHQMTLLRCPKQSTCIVPELQLEKKLKIYLCKHPTKHGVRFYYIAREGLLMHPNVELITQENIDQADFIIYLPGSTPWHLTECTDPAYGKRLIILDEFDGHQLISPTITPEQYIERYGGRNKQWYFMYYKRSFIRRLDGDFKRYPHFSQPDVFPMTYSIAEAYIPKEFNFQREIDILCTLRGTKAMTTRMRAQTWVAEYGISRNIKQIVTSQVNTATRTTVSMAYFQQMFNSRIIVTVNPADWEGDFRLWESLCTGALIFVDPLYVPHPYPLLHGEHVIHFDNNNKTDLFSKLDYYRANPIEARRIAVNGYLHAMKYHRTVNMIDYILRSAHLQQIQKQILLDNISHNQLTTTTTSIRIPHYYYTAQYLNYEAAAQEKAMVACKSPGYYAPVPSDSHIHNITSTMHHIKRLSCPVYDAMHHTTNSNNAHIKSSTGGTHNNAVKTGNIRFGGR